MTTAHCETCHTLREQLAAANAEKAEFKRIGQGFERDMRNHFEQSCVNLARAERAEARVAEYQREVERRDELLAGADADRKRAEAERDEWKKRAGGLQVLVDSAEAGRTRARLQGINTGVAVSESAAEELRTDVERLEAEAARLREALEIAAKSAHIVSFSGQTACACAKCSTVRKALASSDAGEWLKAHDAKVIHDALISPVRFPSPGVMEGLEARDARVRAAALEEAAGAVDACVDETSDLQPQCKTAQRYAAQRIRALATAPAGETK